MSLFFQYIRQGCQIIFLSMAMALPAMALGTIADDVVNIEQRLPSLSGAERVEAFRDLIRLTKKYDTAKAIDYAERLDGIVDGSQASYYLGNLQELATLYMVVSNNDKAIATTERLMTEAERLNEPVYVVEALLVQVSVAVNATSLEKAKALLNVSRQKLQSIDNQHLVARVNYQDAIVHFYLGDNENALALAKAAIPAFQAVGDKSMQAGSENLVGIFYGSMAQYQESLDYLLRALSIFVELENQQKQLSVYNNLAVTYDRLEQPHKALEIYTKTIELCQTIGDVQSESLALLNAASVYNDLTQRTQALAALERGEALAIDIDDKSLRARALNLRAELALEIDAFADAETFAKNAIDLANDMQSPLTQFASYSRLTSALQGQGKLDDALEAAKTMLAFAKSNKSRGEQSTALITLSDVYVAMGNHQAALDLYKQGAELQAELLNEQSKESLMRMQARFENKEKDAEIARMTLQSDLEQKQHGVELALQQHQTYLLGGGLTALFAIALLVYMRISQNHMNARLREEIKEKTRTLQKQHDALAIANQKLEEQSYNDPLTNLANRRFGMTFIPKQAEALLQDYLKQPFDERHVIFVVDIDHFKSINDNYGHAAGDAVIEHIASLLRQSFDDSDYIIRWGGEEFLIMMRYGDAEQATIKAENVRQAVTSSGCKIDDTHEIHCSCSIGFAMYPFFCDQPSELAWTQVTEVADKCLYEAKQTGRNRWVGIDSTLLKYDTELVESLLHRPLCDTVAAHPTLPLVQWQV